jgi:AcrR family transcriptional regulator
MIGRRAAVSKSDFYKHFESKDDCFLAAYDHAVERVRTAVTEACAEAPADDWTAHVGAGITALLTLLAGEPPLATVVLAEGLRAGRGIYDRYQAAVESFVSLLSRRVIAGEAPELTKLVPDVLEFALVPHLGTEGARRIISAG